MSRTLMVGSLTGHHWEKPPLKHFISGQEVVESTADHAGSCSSEAPQLLSPGLSVSCDQSPLEMKDGEDTGDSSEWFCLEQPQQQM